MDPHRKKELIQYSGFWLYPSLRDENPKSASRWLQSRRLDDNIGNLWRVHDKLYDLEGFIEKHPGGKTWIEVTRGTDITEAFEASHLNPSINSILDKYYIKQANSKRISPFTFHSNGFYSTLKRRVHAELSTLSSDQKLAHKQRVVRVQNTLLASFVILFILTGLKGSYWLYFLTGFILFLNINCAHNFFHQKDSWRMYVWDLGLLSSYEWRITHALSHHLFTNSIMDIEISSLEPNFDFRVHPKSKVQQILPGFLLMLGSQIFFFNQIIGRTKMILLGQQKFRPENLLPLAELVVLFFFSERPFIIWSIMHGVSSYVFVIVGIIAAHHHPDLYHPGDGQFRFGTDWGLAQLDAVLDRKDVNGMYIYILRRLDKLFLYNSRFEQEFY